MEMVSDAGFRIFSNGKVNFDDHAVVVLNCGESLHEPPAVIVAIMPGVNRPAEAIAKSKKTSRLVDTI